MEVPLLTHCTRTWVARMEVRKAQLHLFQGQLWNSGLPKLEPHSRSNERHGFRARIIDPLNFDPEVLILGCTVMPCLQIAEAEVCLSQRVQVPNIQGLWSRIPLRVWFWGAESLKIGYLDPLSQASECSKSWFKRDTTAGHSGRWKVDALTRPLGTAITNAGRNNYQFFLRFVSGI